MERGDVPSLTTQRFRRPAGARDVRELESARKRAADILAGRTVWSAVGMPDGGAGARMLGACLAWADDSGVTTRWLDLQADEPLRTVAGELERRLHGGAGGAGAPADADGEVYAGGVGDGDGLMGRGVRADDVVVLHDPLSAVLAEAVRSRGAHAVWEV